MLGSTPAKQTVIQSLQKVKLLPSVNVFDAAKMRDDTNQNVLTKVGRALLEMKHAEQTKPSPTNASKRLKISHAQPITEDAAISEIVARFGGTIEQNDFMMYLTKLFADVEDAEAKINLRRAISLYSGHGGNRQLMAAFLLLFAGVIPGTSGDTFSRNDAKKVVDKREKITSSLRGLCTGSGATKMTKLMKLMKEASKFIASVKGQPQAPHLGTSKNCFEAVDTIKQYLSGKSSWEMVKGNAWEGENTIKAADEMSLPQKNATKVAQMTGIPTDFVPMTRLGVVARVFLYTLPKAVQMAKKTNYDILMELTLMCAKLGSEWALSSMHSLDPALNALESMKDSKNEYEKSVDLNESCNYYIGTVKHLLETAFDPPPMLTDDAKEEEKRVQAALELLLFPYPRDCVDVETKRRTEFADLLRSGKQNEFISKINKQLDAMFMSKLSLKTTQVELDAMRLKKSNFEKYYRQLGELSLTLAHAPHIDKEKTYAEFLWYFLHTVTFRKLDIAGIKRKRDVEEGAETVTKKRKIDFTSEIGNGGDRGDGGGDDIDKSTGRGKRNGFFATVKSYAPSTPTVYNYMNILGTFLPIVFSMGGETTNLFFKFFQHLITAQEISSLTMSQLIIAFFGEALTSKESEELRKLEKDKHQVFSLWNCLCMRKDHECGMLNIMSSVTMKTSVLIVVCWAVSAFMWSSNPMWFVLQQHWVIDFAVEKGLGYEKGPLKSASAMAARGLRGVVRKVTVSPKADHTVAQASRTVADTVQPSPSIEDPSKVAASSAASWHQRFASLIPASLKGKPSEEKKMVKQSIFKKKRHLFG